MPSRSSPSSCRNGERRRAARAARLARSQSRPGVDSTGGRLPQRRERRRDQHLVFLPDRANAGLRRPLATLARFLADPRALVGVLIRPDVHDLVERTEVGVPEGAELRMFLAEGLPLREAVLELGHGSGAQGVGANFVNHLLLLGVDATRFTAA